jgi:hypothetical protein
VQYVKSSIFSLFVISLAVGCVSESGDDPAANNGGTTANNATSPDMGTDAGDGIPEGGARIVHAFGSVELAAGEETTPCVQWTLNNDQPIYIDKVTLTNGGGYHHSNWFVVPNNFASGEDGYFNCGDRGFNEVSAATAGTVLFAQSTQSRIEEQDLPDGVTIKVPPDHKVIGSLHLLNINTQPLDTPLNMAFDIIHPRDVDVVVTPFRLTYYPLEIEPNGETRFQGNCNFREDYERAAGKEMDLKLYYVLPHYHELGNAFRLDLLGGENDGETLFALEGFNAEANGQAFDPPIDFATNDADGLSFTCGYNNPRDEMVGWGIGDQEMCVMLGLADADLLMDISIPRGADTDFIGDDRGVPVKSGSCFVLPLPKNPSQTMPTQEEIDGELYVPDSDEAEEGEILPTCKDFPGGTIEPLAEPTIENVQRDLFQPGCTFSACHDSENPAFGLDLESPGVRERLLGHTLMTNADMPLVTPGDPEQSWLWRVSSECEPMAGEMPMSPMPRNAPTLAADNVLEMLRLWIENGAQ